MLDSLWPEWSLAKKAGYMYLHCVGSPRRKVCCVWKSSLPCTIPQDACRLLTSLSVVTQYPTSWGKVCQMMSHREAYDHYFLIALWVEFSLCRAWHSKMAPELMSSEGNCLYVFLFWNDFATHLSCSKDKKLTNHNNHTLPQTALPGLLFSKSGYTYVGSAQHSIDIYRK